MAGAQPPRVTATVQQRLANVSGALGWEDVGAAVALQASRAQGVATFATGAVQLPGGVARSDLRLVFRELERLRVDGMKAAEPATYGERPVWAEILTLG